MKNEITKSYIEKNTRSKEITTGTFGRKYRHNFDYKNEAGNPINFENNSDNAIIKTVMTDNKPVFECIGHAENKKEFIDLIHSHINVNHQMI